MSVLLQPLGPILAIDDAEDDRFFLRRLLNKVGCRSPVIEFSHANAAMEYLTDVAQSKPRIVAPSLIISDVHMRTLSGFDFLEWVKAQEAWKPLPVVMLSTSDDVRDITRATQLGASRYIIKFPQPDVVAQVLAEFGGHRRE